MKGLRSLYIIVLLLLSAMAFGQTATVKGRVVNDKNEAIQNVIITVNGISLAVTDLDGAFTLSSPAGKEVTITFRLNNTEQKLIKRTFAVDEVAQLNIKLDVKGADINGVVIVAEKPGVAIDPITTVTVASPSGGVVRY